MLHGHAAAHRGDAVDGSLRDGFGVVEEPVQAGQRHVLVDAFEDIQRARDGFVIGGVQAPGPAVLRQDAHHFLKLAFHLRAHFRARLPEVFEVGRREHQHFTGAVVAEVVRALLVLRGCRPGGSSTGRRRPVAGSLGSLRGSSGSRRQRRWRR
ncbi:hypothetical protein G6F59_015504 [Rhizopus arrhizus]|nr:hypothetical protein G6F59_015504 [Rhizopus arrhizus]